MTNLLIVDDDQDLLNTLSEYFIRVGYMVTKAINGLEALEFFKHADFDLALLDVELPEMNGIELTKEIKKINQDFPIILITGYSHLYRPQDVLSLDVEAFLKKPLNLQELVSIVNQIISRNRTGLMKQ
jgi:CheY-like chemotaxis protein